MSRLTAPTAPDSVAQIWGDKKPSYFFVETRGNAGALIINRLLASNVKASWLEASVDVNGFHYPTGSLTISSGPNVPKALQTLAGRFGLRVDGARGKPLAAVRSLVRTRVGVYKPWDDNPDEGWTRWVLEQYEFPFVSLSPDDVRNGKLRDRFDAIVLPSAPPSSLINGVASDEAPSPYAGGLGENGLQSLETFVQAGGTLICLDQSGGLAIDLFRLPITNVVQAAGDKVLAPGTMLHIDTAPDDPLSAGVPARTTAVFVSSSAYDVARGPAVKVAARYATDDLLAGGLLRGGEILQGKAAVLSANVGAGRVVLLGFRAQHRGQSLATFRFLFNAIFFAR
jgi:hypothetical protein